MGRMMRFLFMFGPMIYRQYNKYMSSKNATKRQEEQYANQDEMAPRNQPKKADVNDKDFV